jgi:tripeptidyl-peptidase-2
MKKYLITFLLLTLLLISEKQTFPFLDNKAMGTYEFISENPEYDGRGVVIFILDNAVDPAIPGLTKTSTGKTKVIDMQDFSGQTVLPLIEASPKEINGASIIANDNTYLEGYDMLDLKPIDDVYYLATISEADLYKNSPVKDLNNNGKTNDEFNILAFKINSNNPKINDFNGFVKPDGDLWVYYVDEDADGNIDDESPKFNYKYNYDTFNFFKGNEDTRPLLTMSANIENNKIIINTGDGSHGSHCAGIAAGFGIYGTEGNDGIAPGAYVVSLKIGSNILSGGATTDQSMRKAYEYGIDFMKEAGFEYAVFSMSYGIGAEEPGKSDMAEYLNQFVIDNPNAIVVTSNGNEGPGIRSTGLPAGADRIISVGAMLPPQVLKNLYGSARDKHWMTHFSSRGGACAKPDVVAPAGASSTVPAYERGDAFWGTSMSCPQVAGACAVLVSAAIKNDIKINNFMIKKAIKYTATELQGYNHIDYGNGLVNVPAAFDYLKVLSKREEYKKILDYEIITDNPYYTSGQASASYWNNGGYFPSGSSKQNVTIKAIFPKDNPKKNNHDFYRVLRLKSDADWLKPDKSKVYIRGELQATIGLVYDKSKLQNPGLYIARISGFADNETSSGYADMDIQTSVVIPNKFNEENDYKLKYDKHSLAPGDIERIFVEVPAGASAMIIKLSPVQNKNYGMAMYLISPDGNHHGYGNSSDANNNKPIEISVNGKDLAKGIWEIIPYNYFQSRDNSFYNLEVEFFGIESKNINHITFNQGEKPQISTKIYNNFNKSLEYIANGSIVGYCKNNEIADETAKTYKKTFKIDNNIRKAEFYIEMPIEEYNKFTDIAVNIYDESGKSVLSSGLSRRYGTFTFHPKSTGTYTLEIVPGFATMKSKSDDWTFTIDEKYYYHNRIGITSESNKMMIYPLDQQKINFLINGTVPLVPESYKSFGNIDLIETDNSKIVGKIYLTY